MLYPAPDHLILLFPTKESWRNPSKIEYIEEGLSKFVRSYAQHSITSIAFPKLGCGNGELSWNDVKPIMEMYLKPLPIDIYIYLSNRTEDTPEHRIQKRTMNWLKENAKDLSFNAVKEEIELESSIAPIELSFDHNSYNVVYDSGLVFSNKKTKALVSIGEDELFQMWDSVRRKRVFGINGDEKEAIVYALLCELGYLSAISIADNTSNIMKDGYQVKEGLERAYSLNWSKQQ